MITIGKRRTPFFVMHGEVGRIKTKGHCPAPACERHAALAMIDGTDAIETALRQLHGPARYKVQAGASHPSPTFCQRPVTSPLNKAAVLKITDALLIVQTSQMMSDIPRDYLTRCSDISAPIDNTFANEKVGLAASRLPDRRGDCRPIQPIYRYCPAPSSCQLDLNMLAASRALQVKPFLVTSPHFPKNKAVAELIRWLRHIFHQEIGTTKKPDINHKLNPGEWQSHHEAVSRNGSISPLPS